MIASVKKRLIIIASKIKRDTYIQHSTWRDVAHELSKHYGRFKVDIKKRTTFEQNNDMLRVEVDGRVVYWPANAARERLADMYFEVFYRGNNHYFDVPETSLYPGDVVLDCGACEGYFTHKALEAGAEKIHCIEPGKTISQCLEKTFTRGIQADKVVVHSYLLGEKNERVAFYEDPHDPTICKIITQAEAEAFPKGRIRTIELLTIDEFCARHSVDRVDFIKADVEGGEVGLLRGAEKTIKKFRPKLAIAAYHNPDDANRIVEFIHNLGLGYKFKVKGIVVFENIARPVMAHCFQ